MWMRWHVRKLLRLLAEGEAPRTYYSVAETAEIFGMSDQTLYRAINDGQFPAVRVRGRLFVPAKVVDALAKAALQSGGLIDAADWTAGDAT
jgi:excisionase family DNA binding protein